MTGAVRRRDVITLMGSGVIAWPLAARAQQREKIPLVGILIGGAAQTEQARLEAFINGLAALGWRDGDTVRIERRVFDSDPDRADALGAELMALKPDVVWTISGPGLSALERASRTIPVVFMNVADPVASGFVTDLAHPGGNATGFSVYEPSIGGKWLESLREIAPQVSHVGMLVEAGTTNENVRENFVATAARLHVPAATFALRGPSEIENAIAHVASEPDGGLIVAPSNVTGLHQQQIFAQCAQHKIPAIYAYDFYARNGGLVSYGPDLLLQAKGCAGYADKILRGAKSGELPIQLPTKFILVINLKTAKSLGLAVPPSLLARADEVIE